MSFFNIFKKKPTAEELEAKRIEYLRNNGRIVDGTITDSETTDFGELVCYVYTVQGADFESSEYLNEEKLQNIVKYSPGAKVGVRYDPRNHGNSLLV
jgi:hypothetical protein